ncbi:MAG TPA: septum formation initiator family protein [Thermoanaerobaculia bacterium]|nr:septum formation initiator family protein [Thermoanaerobaculia bacterium]
MTQAAQARAARPRPLRSLLSALFVFLLLVLATAALKGWRDLDRSRVRETELKARIAATEQRIETLRREIHDLQSDPATLERVAREDLGLVRPDEVVVVLPSAEPVR